MKRQLRNVDACVCKILGLQSWGCRLLGSSKFGLCLEFKDVFEGLCPGGNALSNGFPNGLGPRVGGGARKACSNTNTKRYINCVFSKRVRKE